MTRRLSGSITVRLGAQALRLVRARAKARKVAVSDVVREVIEAELSPPKTDVSAHELSRAWVGAINDARITPGAKAREGLADWDPDRR
jgi:hypothetical protein